MTDNVEKYPPIPEERLKKYQDLWNNSRSSDGIDPDVARHLSRVKALHGQGIEFLSGLNNEYLGAFMAPSRGTWKMPILLLWGCLLKNQRR